ncbi:MAG: hypothetical protein KAY65_12930, partial [Planctomycetes bacterium]|nr:hypothetical protein [Planctomycetota bacterium]
MEVVMQIIRTKINWLTITVVLVLALMAVPGWADVERARQILDATGVKGGLVVHIGCGDGKLTAALRANDSFIV